MAEMRRRLGDEETLADMVIQQRLGHVAHVPDHRIPKSVLFGWLSQPRPQGGPRKRWRDVVRKDLKGVRVVEEELYEEARRSRAGWRLCAD